MRRGSTHRTHPRDCHPAGSVAGIATRRSRVWNSSSEAYTRFYNEIYEYTFTARRAPGDELTGTAARAREMERVLRIPILSCCWGDNAVQ